MAMKKAAFILPKEAGNPVEEPVTERTRRCANLILTTVTLRLH